MQCLPRLNLTAVVSASIAAVITKVSLQATLGDCSARACLQDSEVTVWPGEVVPQDRMATELSKALLWSQEEVTVTVSAVHDAMIPPLITLQRGERGLKMNSAL